MCKIVFLNSKYVELVHDDSLACKCFMPSNTYGDVRNLLSPCLCLTLVDNLATFLLISVQKPFLYRSSISSIFLTLSREVVDCIVCLLA